MDDHVRQIVEELHDTPAMAALVISGGGTQAIGWLTGVPGATRTLLEGVVPYGWQAMVDYLGWLPDQYASRETAISLAAAAYSRAVRFREATEPVFGLSCTASIASDRPKRGPHRAHVALWDGTHVTTHFLKFKKGRRERPDEDGVVAQLILRVLAQAAGLTREVPVDLAVGEEIVTERLAVDRPLERLLDGSVGSLMVYGPEVMVPDVAFRAVILPGSFNPLHGGHLSMARVAERRFDLPTVFEISAHNVDKPPLPILEIERRLEQFEGTGRRVVISREPLYRDKAALYPGNPFVVGYDTAVRIVDPVYYHDDPDEMIAALEAVRAAGCRFLVAGRLGDIRFNTRDDLPIPTGFEDLFEGIPEAEFRVDLSSTELRR